MIVGITGHRPSKLGASYDLNAPIRVWIREQLYKQLVDLRPSLAISGMAIGVDTDFVLTCLALKIPYVAAVPFHGQASRWRQPDQELYKKLLSTAHSVKVISESYSPEAFQLRNQWIVDNCDTLIAVWNGSAGGTGNAVRYAESIHKPLVRILPSVSNPSYDPLLYGARCFECPLAPYRNGPVPSEMHSDAIVTVVALCPGKNEVERSRPLVGRSGHLHDSTVSKAGFSRHDANLVNLIECRVPEEFQDDLDAYLKWLRKNRPDAKNPIDCCAPRRRLQLQSAKSLLLYGAHALKHVAGFNGVKKYAGHTLEVEVEPHRKVWAVPATHPAGVLRELTEYIDYEAHVGRAYRIAYQGHPSWHPGRVLLNATTEQFINWWSARGKTVAVDVETDGLDFSRCNVRCIGASEVIDGGARDETCVYAIRSTTGPLLKSDAQLTQALNCIRTIFPLKTLVAHNRKAEATVFERFGIDPRLWHCTMELDHSVHSEQRHDLRSVVTRRFDVPPWKADVKFVDTTDDNALWRYNAVDDIGTARIFPWLLEKAKKLGVLHTYPIDLMLSEQCRQMTKLGIAIDRAAQRRLGENLYKKFIEYLNRIRGIVGDSEFNVFSPHQIGRWIYEHKGYSALEFTKTGAPSTSKTALLLLVEAGVDREMSEFIDLLFESRWTGKILNTYVGIKLSLQEDREDNDDEPDNLSIGFDGRSHPTWSSHVVPSGRLACSRPGIQQQPKVVREMFSCEAGHVLVGIDLSQVELRIIVAVANVRKYKEIFAAGGDIHDYGTEKMLGVTRSAVQAQYKRAFSGKHFDSTPHELEDGWTAPGVPPEEVIGNAAKVYYSKLRTIAKNLNHAKNYTATDKKTYSMIRLNPRIPFEVRSKIEPRFIKNACNAWRQEYPEIPAFQERCYTLWRQQGWLETLFHRRKRFFADGEKDRGALPNHIVQGTVGDHMNEAFTTLLQEIPFDHQNKTGVILQNHDQFVVEVREDFAE